MEFSYTITEAGVRIDRVSEPETEIWFPEKIEDRTVVELGPYILSASDVEAVHLPSGLRKTGAYGFYGCGKLRRIFCGGRILDLGAGLFAGAGKVEFLDITLYEGERSCFKDLLSELRQTLRVRVHVKAAGGDRGGGMTPPDGANPGGEPAVSAGGNRGGGQEPSDGAGREARLIFPEYFEESVENTPARILFIETHGCGHRYRYCFAGREFQYRAYDELFAHVRVQESEELVTELALGRLLFPCGLTEKYEAMYREYVAEHWRMAGQLLLDADRMDSGSAGNGGRVGSGSVAASLLLEPGRIPWLAEGFLERPEQASELIAMAQKTGDTENVGWLMDFVHRKWGGTCAGALENGKRKRRFEL